jgi:serpin B
MRIPPRAACVCILSVLAGCGESTGPSAAPPLLSALPRPLTVAESTLAAASNRFAFGMLAQARAEAPSATVFLSPLSASMALGMTLNGAAGETFDQMRAALGFGSLSQAEINAGYKGLLELLGGLDRTSELLVANSIWAESGFPFLPAFMTAGRDWFDAEVRNVSFADPAALDAVNAWVREKTSNKIPTLLDQIDRSTVMTLLNAVYFKGTWRQGFAKADTRTASFNGTDGSQPVPMMHQEEETLYAETAMYQAVDLLYGNGGFGMTIVLPRPGVALGEALGTDPAQEWAALHTRFSEQTVALSLPRFQLNYRRVLTPDLRSLGMVLAFDDHRADFSRMAAPPIQLFLSSVIQKTFVDVNEEGTEAAAATAVEVVQTSMPQTHTMDVNRPFLVAIRERFSGTLLFLGQVTAIPAT